MNATERRILIAGVAVGAVVGSLCYALLKAPPPSECEQAVVLAAFDKEDVRRMLDTPDADGARFYLAKGAQLTVVAGPIRRDMSHCPETTTSLFQEFIKLDGTMAVVDQLKEVDAERTVRNSNTTAKPTWSIDASRTALNNLLAITDANAIGVVERKTTNGGWSFDLVPLKIQSSTAKTVGRLNDALSAAPCPRFCGADASLYLHLR